VCGGLEKTDMYVPFACALAPAIWKYFPFPNFVGSNGLTTVWDRLHRAKRLFDDD